jgi:hypothetical protein
MQTNINITKAFLETPDGVLSIHQVSKKLKLPYGTAYNRIHSLQKMKILTIFPQGKAKLCALNPENPMTASLLALGSSQKTQKTIISNEDIGKFIIKVRKTIEEIGDTDLITSILLTPDTLKQICSPQTNLNLPTTGEFSEIEEDRSIPLDLFFVTSSENFEESKIETAINTLVPPGVPVKATSMCVNKDTLLGMLKETENEAGLAAYHMLHDGIVLTGFENFYSLVLEAFPKRLT